MTEYDAAVLTARPALAAWFEDQVAEEHRNWEKVIHDLKKSLGNAKEWPGEYGNTKPRKHWPAEGAVHPIEIGASVEKKLKKRGVIK